MFEPLFLVQTVVLVILGGIAGLVWWNLREYRRPVPRGHTATGHGGVPPGGSLAGEACRAPLVSILIPARNESGNIERCLAGVLRQTHPALEVLVLDDGSTDDTAARVMALAARDARLQLVSGVPLPPGWGGKTHACAQLAGQANGEWLLFLDADTRVEPELLALALAEAETRGRDLLSTFPRQIIGSPGEALTVPFVFWLLFTLLPMYLVRASSFPAFSAACGQMLLVRRRAYRTTGGHGSIPASLHDGLHLARLFKRSGCRVTLADLSPWIECRMYRNWTECWNGFCRNAFQGIGSFPTLLGLTLVEAGLFLGPCLWCAAGVASGWPAWAWPVGGQVLILAGIHAALRRRFRYPAATVLLHPAGIAVLVAIQWTSWFLTVTRRPVLWKGRSVCG